MKKKWALALQILVPFLVTVLANVYAVPLITANKDLRVSLAVFSVILFLYVVALISNSADHKTQRQHELELRKKSRAFWIEPLLNTLADGPSWIQIKMRWLDQSLNDDDSNPLAGASIYEAYLKAKRSLLILGTPGSGKTITMLLLARQLADLAEEDRANPVPVIFNLSLWSPQHESLFLWLLHELREKYFVPESIGRQLLEKNRLALLLDGLDEVAEINGPSCVRAINDFIRRPITEPSASLQILVCCRHEEYKALKSLALHERLHPLRLEAVPDEEVQRFLVDSATNSAKLKRALATNESLRTLSKSPLMLTLIRAAYEGDEKFLPGKWPTAIREAQESVLDTYIDTRLNGISANTAVADERLSWLATQMHEQSNSIFLLERLQPSWLENRSDRIIYVVLSRLSGAMIGWMIGVAILWVSHFLATLLWLGEPPVASPGLLNVQQGLGSWLLITGGLGGITVGLIDSFALLGKGESKFATYRKRLPAILWAAVKAAFYMICCGLIFFSAASWRFGARQGVFGALIYGPIFGLVFWFRGRGQTLDNDVRTADKLGWNLSGLPKGFAWGLLAGVLIGIVAWLAVGTILGAQSGKDVAYLVGATGVLIGSFLGVMEKVSIGDRKLSPNQGIIMSLKNTFWIFIYVGLPLLLIYWLLGFVITKEPRPVFESAMFFALVIGFLLAFAYGGLDVIYHYVLRAILARKLVIPFKYVAFLNKAARLRLLTRVGGAYVFVHPYVRDRLALRGRRHNQAKPGQKRRHKTKAKEAALGARI